MFCPSEILGVVPSALVLHGVPSTAGSIGTGAVLRGPLVTVSTKLTSLLWLPFLSMFRKGIPDMGCVFQSFGLGPMMLGGDHAVLRFLCPSPQVLSPNSSQMLQPRAHLGWSMGCC